MQLNKELAILAIITQFIYLCLISLTFRKICMKGDLDHQNDLTTHVVTIMSGRGSLTHVKEIGENEGLLPDGHQSEHAVPLVSDH